MDIVVISRLSCADSTSQKPIKKGLRLVFSEISKDIALESQRWYSVNSWCSCSNVVYGKILSASKAERSGSSLQSIIKTIITKAEETKSTASAIRSAIIKTVDHRDIGQGEASRILFSGNHWESTFKFVHVSLDLDVTQITRDKKNWRNYSKI